MTFVIGKKFKLFIIFKEGEKLKWVINTPDASVGVLKPPHE